MNSLQLRQNTQNKKIPANTEFISSFRFLAMTALLVSCLVTNLQAQEAVHGLSVNPGLLKITSSQTGNSALKAAYVSSSTLSLPFRDDFSFSLISTNCHFPDSTLWSDSDVYINSNLPLNPPDYGAATFDALNKDRMPYTLDTLEYFGADTLTSRPINLKYSPADSVYLSFAYEPKGYGYAPEPKDSLILEFYIPDSAKWIKIWGVPGTGPDEFKTVMIPITDGKYLKNGFRFRFRNFATLSGNPDFDKLNADSIGLWHLDRVVLDKNRNSADTDPQLFTDSIHLPLVDDFSSTAPYPNPDYWSDKDVYINSDFPVNPPSIGVATFDAFNTEGLMYPNTPDVPFQADRLTSNPINLTYPAKDSVYLSFFYEPKGVGGIQGGYPLPEDSLLLDFFDPDPRIPDSLKWHTVWKTPGGDTTAVFKQVMVPITDPRYLTNGFRFRFRNYATVLSNLTAGKMSDGNFWHIDYVRLDYNRDVHDTVIHDVAFTKPLPSLLKDYQAIPWPQFESGEQLDLLQPSVTVTYRNNDNTYRTSYIHLSIKDIYDNTVNNMSETVESDKPNSTVNFTTNLLNPFNPYTTDSALFEIKSILRTDAFDNKWNDTIKFRQVFKNYYAFDDGSAESGYGLEGERAVNAMAAMQFRAYFPDTLTGIAFNFVPTYQNESLHYTFRYAVWADNKGVPGKMLYLSNIDSVKYGHFPIYKLDSAVAVSGYFYVGWVQYDDNFLNIGLDLNSNLDPTKLFLNYQEPWVKSSLMGTLMIRPITGNSNGVYLSTRNKTASSNISIYPNPATDYISVQGFDSATPVGFTLYSITGKPLIQQKLNDSHTIDVSNFPTGLYFIRFTSGDRVTPVVKLLIQH